jgi:two-component system LytT family response regulator
MEFLAVDDIVAIAADGDHAVVRTANGTTARVRKPIREWASRLPAQRFARVNRSAIVNLAYVTRVEPWSHASFRVHLRGIAEPVLMSRRYAARVRRELS